MITSLNGLTINLGGGYSFIHDQISLRKGDVSEEDILLQRRELSNTFTRYTSCTIVYTFGSLYNNVVNPRFDGYKN